MQAGAGAFVLGLSLLLGGCARPAKLYTNLDIGTRAPDLTVVTLHVKNEEARATTPLTIDVSLRFRHGSEWDKSVSVIHPSAFVLNKLEEQIQRSIIKKRGDAVRATLTIKEQENGTVVASETKEWSSTDASHGPAIPRPPDK